MPVSRAKLLDGEQTDRAASPNGALGSTSVQRWLNGIGQDIINVDGMRVGNGARDSRTIINPDLVTHDAEGHAFTPRWNVRGDFENESQFGGPWHDKGYLTLLALALAGGAAGGLEGGVEGAGTGAFDVGGSTGFGGTIPLDSGAGAGTGAFDVGGSTGFGGSTPLGTVTSDGTIGQTFPSGYGGLDPETASQTGWGPGTNTTVIPGEGPGSIDVNGPETGGGPGEGPGGGSSGVDSSSWWDTIQSGLDKLSSMKGLPGLISSLTGGAKPVGGGVSGAGGSGVGGGGSHLSGKVDLVDNPYAKAKIAVPGTLMSYLRGL